MYYTHICTVLILCMYLGPKPEWCYALHYKYRVKVKTQLHMVKKWFEISFKPKVKTSFSKNKSKLVTENLISFSTKEFPPQHRALFKFQKFLEQKKYFSSLQKNESQIQDFQIWFKVPHIHTLHIQLIFNSSYPQSH